jgi:hypothetical protein
MWIQQMENNSFIMVFHICYHIFNWRKLFISNKQFFKRIRSLYRILNTLPIFNTSEYIITFLKPNFQQRFASFVQYVNDISYMTPFLQQSFINSLRYYPSLVHVPSFPHIWNRLHGALRNVKYPRCISGEQAESVAQANGDQFCRKVEICALNAPKEM